MASDMEMTAMPQRILPDVPQHLFVGAMDGVTTCTPDTELHDIWPKFIVMVILQGEQHFTIDGQRFDIDAGQGREASPVVFMLNVARFCKLQFINESEVPLRKVMISAPFPWVERLIQSQPDGMPKLEAFFAQHLSQFSFRPSQHIVHLSEQIVDPPSAMRGELQTLYRRSHAMDILCHACALMLESEEGASARAGLMSRRQSERVREYIAANIRRDLTIENIAREVGLSTSSVQRHFKEHFGLTIFEFIRQKRLESARWALESDGVPIAQAAYIAGYNSPSSFTTAFKKAYGVSPKYRRA